MAEIDARPAATSRRRSSSARLRPGDLGWLVERHGALYAEEYGWDESFERLVAKIVADFDPASDQAWIAEYAGARAGCVLCVHKDETTAMLRTLLVEPHARGSGLGAPAGGRGHPPRQGARLRRRSPCGRTTC